MSLDDGGYYSAEIAAREAAEESSWEPLCEGRLVSFDPLSSAGEGLGRRVPVAQC